MLAVGLLAVASMDAAAQGIPCASLPLPQPPSVIKPTPESRKVEQGRSSVGMSQEEWDIEHCVSTPSDMVSALRPLFAAAKDSASAEPLLGALARDWPSIRDSRAMQHPEVGPQSVVDVIEIARMTAQLPESIQESVRAVPVDASLDLAAGLYQRWADSVLKVKRKEGERIAKTGVPPYEIVRAMIRIDKTRATLGHPAGALEEARGLLESAWNNGARRVPCNSTRADFDRISELSRVLGMMGSKVDLMYPVEQALVRWTRAEAKGSDQPARAKLAEAATSFGLKGLASEINSGKIQPNNPHLSFSPEVVTLEPKQSADLELTFVTCGKEPATDRALTLSVTPMTFGALSVTEVRTDANGKAKVRFTAGAGGGRGIIQASYFETDLRTGERERRHADAIVDVIQWKGTITVTTVDTRDSTGSRDGAQDRYVQRDSAQFMFRVDGERGTSTVSGRLVDDWYHRGAPVPCEGGVWVDRRRRQRRGTYSGGGPVTVTYSRQSRTMWVITVKDAGYRIDTEEESRFPRGECHDFETTRETQTLTMEGSEHRIVATLTVEGTGADARERLQGEERVQIGPNQTITISWDLTKR